jgi:hypothetical protein
LQRNEEENQHWYEVRDDEDEPLEVPLLRLNIPVVEPPVPTIKHRLQAIALQWPDESNPVKTEAIKVAMEEHFVGLRSEWDALYNRKDHFALRDSIVEQLKMNANERRKAARRKRRNNTSN